MKKFIAQVSIGNEWGLGQGKPAIGNADQFKTPGNLISIILQNVYVVSGILLFVLLLFGGISIILGAGQNDPKKAAQGQKAITSALFGFLIVFASYWIIKIIEIVTGLNIFEPGI